MSACARFDAAVLRSRQRALKAPECCIHGDPLAAECSACRALGRLFKGMVDPEIRLIGPLDPVYQEWLERWQV